MRYYKTNKPEAIEASRKYLADVITVQRAGEAFAARYPGARPLFKTDVFGREFHGLLFEPVMTSPLWTRPLRASGGIQRPRTTLERGTTGEDRVRMIAALAEVNEAWNEHMPRERADRIPVWDALGTDWGSVMMGGFQSFEQDGFIYMRTAICSVDGVEILGSEYDSAKDRHQGNAGCEASRLAA